MSKPKLSALDTIGLQLTTAPRRYRYTNSQVNQSDVNEVSLLQSEFSAVVLGDPGAGKTTTLKRLALTVLTQEATGDKDVYKFPLVLLLRDLPDNKYICEEIAEVFGVQYEKKIRPEVATSSDDRLPTVLSRSDFNITVEGEQLDIRLTTFLNEFNVLILVDGLDELALARRHSVERELEALNGRLTKSKIVLSCRSGDYNSTMQGFQLFEILPLTSDEVTDISAIWLEDPADFLRSLASTPYADIVDRPLLLSFLLFLYGSDGRLPDQPASIYKRVVYRLLFDWDQERRIRRGSKYAAFDADRKIDFLSELAYYLTFKIKSKTLTERAFDEAYADIAPAFRLPLTESKQVASEIETHTGLVVRSGINSLEFAHLSIQEYLCGNFICRSPVPHLLREYLSEYPAPVAVACALSSDPSQFFTEIMVRQVVDSFREPTNPLHAGLEQQIGQMTLNLFGEGEYITLKSFLHRLQIENPTFRSNIDFGKSILCLFAFYYRRYDLSVDQALEDAMILQGTCESVVSAIEARPRPLVFGLTDHTVVFEMDAWFQSIYKQRVADIWPPAGREAELLPLVLLPKAIYDLVERPLHTDRNALQERIYRSLRNTPFCQIENSGHSYPHGKGSNKCAICGNEQIIRTLSSANRRSRQVTPRA